MNRCHRSFLVIGVWTWISAIAMADAPADADGDGDVDVGDYLTFVECLSGVGTPAGGSCTEYFDFDLDAAVNLLDFATFQRCFGGSDQPVNHDCASHLARIENGCLHIIGTADDTSLTLRLRLGRPTFLDVDVGNDGHIDFTFDRSQFDCILVDARGGDDLVWIDEVNGVFTDTEMTTINGGRGEDTLLGGSGPEHFEGGPGNDTLSLGGGDDLVVWNPGDDSDVVDGGEGFDTVEVNGDNDAEQFSVTANGTNVRVDRLNPSPFTLDLAACDRLVLHANDGDDSVSCTGNLAALIAITLDGGPGNDTLLGSNGADVLIGGDDDDFIDGNQGNDVVLMGAGNDTFHWDPGDGSDTVEGESGDDVVDFNGSNTNEIFDLSSNGGRLLFMRNVGNIVLDVNGVETFDLHALGGTDITTVNDLAGTDLTQVDIDLAATLGGSAGDAQVDTVVVVPTANADSLTVSFEDGYTVAEWGAKVRVLGYEVLDTLQFDGAADDSVTINGTSGPDNMTITVNGTRARIDATGFSAAVEVGGAPSLTLNGLEGEDLMSCTGNLAGLPIPLTLDGGPGNDTLLGSNGADVLIGGDDDDFIDGNQGNDVVLMGAGNDTFHWDPGDGSDTVEGESGDDVVDFNGSNTNEIFDLSSNGGRLLFMRNVGNIVLDVNGVETFDLHALGGTDITTVNDLAGTDLTQVDIDLAATLGGSAGDAQADSTTVNGTDSADTVHVAADAGDVTVAGLAALVRIMHADPAIDSLTVNGLGGVDAITADAAVAALILLTINP